MQNKITQKILGIDPGYGRLGIAVIEKNGAKEKLLHSECFETSQKLPHPERLALVAERLEEIIDQFEPNKIALETLLFSKNVKTAIQVAEVRGIILFLATKRKVKIFEYNPNQIKLAVTGYGKSDKKQIINMVEKLLKLPAKNRLDDEYDAIAIAITCGAISLSTEKPF